MNCFPKLGIIQTFLETFNPKFRFTNRYNVPLKLLVQYSDLSLTVTFPLDLVIIIEFGDWLWENIFASFSRENESNGDSEYLATLLFRTNEVILWRSLQKR